MKTKLLKSDWLNEGVRVLAASGPSALRVAPMAARLAISRGSFYWHFRDLGDFKRQLLARWRERVTDCVIFDLDIQQAKPNRLKSLLRRAMSGQRNRLEDAVRLWAREDRAVAAAVASVDAKRIFYIAQLLIDSGVGRLRAHERAGFIYWAWLGQAGMISPRHGAISISALDDIARLFER